MRSRVLSTPTLLICLSRLGSFNRLGYAVDRLNLSRASSGPLYRVNTVRVAPVWVGPSWFGQLMAVCMAGPGSSVRSIQFDYVGQFKSWHAILTVQSLSVWFWIQTANFDVNGYPKIRLAKLHVNSEGKLNEIVRFVDPISIHEIDDVLFASVRSWPLNLHQTVVLILTINFSKLVEFIMPLNRNWNVIINCIQNDELCWIHEIRIVHIPSNKFVKFITSSNLLWLLILHIASSTLIDDFEFIRCPMTMKNISPESSSIRKLLESTMQQNSQLSKDMLRNFFI